MVSVLQPGAVPEGFKVLKEGAASVLLRGNDVFYNEAQVTNRDLSVAVLREFLPILAREHKEGRYKKQQRHAKKQHRKSAKAAAFNEDTDNTTTTEPQKLPESGPHADVVDADNLPQQKKEVPQGDTLPGPDDTGNHGQPSTSGRHRQGSERLATVLEGLAASGMRSIRYALEVPGIARIDANDLDKAVCESMKLNVTFNGPPASSLIRVLHSDARLTMMRAPLEYDVIDLDPYGTPSQLLDSAVQSVADGGLLLVTATDMANLCGNNSTACWSNYSSYPIHRSYCHEQALRILLACIEANANRYKRHIHPLLSVSIDFYIRVFVRVYTSAAAVKDTPCKLAYVWQSSGCDSFWLQPVGEKKQTDKQGGIKYMPTHGPAVPNIKCPDSDSSYLMGGPIWANPIHDHAFVAELLKSLDRDKDRYAQHAKLRGLLSSVVDELPTAPLYYNLHEVCKTVKVTPFKSEMFRSALINAGFSVSGSHASPLAIKTDAPPSVIWDIIRCWVRDHPVNIKDSNSYAAKILAKEPTLQASFARASAAVRKQDGPRFPENPAFWGPKSRHGRPPVPKPQGATDIPVSNNAEVVAGAEAAETLPAVDDVVEEVEGAAVRSQGDETAHAQKRLKTE